MKHAALSILAAAVLALSSPALAADAPAKVAMILPPLNTEFWRSVKAGAEAAADSLAGLDLTVAAPAREATPEQQIQSIEDAVAAGARVVVVAPQDEVQLTPALADVVSRGVKVIVLESDTLWPDKAAFVGPNNAMGGYAAADYIVKRLNGVGRVAMITAGLGAREAVMRANGAREAFRMNRGVTVVGVRDAGGDRFRAMEEMENLLTLDPDLHAVFCSSDAMALGALEAVRAAGSEAFVVGFGASPEALRSILDDGLAATVAQNGVLAGRMAASTAYRLATGRRIPPFIDTGIELLTKENAERYIVDQFIQDR